MLLEFCEGIVRPVVPGAPRGGRRIPGVRLDLEVGQLRIALRRVREVVGAAREHVEALDLRHDVEEVLHVVAAEAVDDVRRVAVGQRQRRVRAGTDQASGRRVHRAHDAIEAPGAESQRGLARTLVRQSHEGQVVGPDVVLALVHGVRFLLLVVERDVGIVLVLGQVADAAGDRRLVLVAFAVVRGAGGAGHRDAGELLAQDDVDHAGHGVGTIDGGRAVLQHFDALDSVERDLLDVHVRRVAVIGQAEIRHAAAVHEDEGVVGPQAAQRNAGAGSREAVGERRTNLAVVVGGDLADDVGDRLETRGLDIFARDRFDRCRGFRIDPLDVGTGHIDFDVLCPHGSGSEQCKSADAQRGRDFLPLKFHVKNPQKWLMPPERTTCPLSGTHCHFTSRAFSRATKGCDCYNGHCRFVAISPNVAVSLTQAHDLPGIDPIRAILFPGLRDDRGELRRDCATCDAIRSDLALRAELLRIARCCTAP